MKALVGAFNQEKALVGAFSVIVKPVVEPMDRFTALEVNKAPRFPSPRNNYFGLIADTACGAAAVTALSTAIVA